MSEMADSQIVEIDEGLNLIEQISDIKLIKAIKTLSTQEVELLVKIVLEDKKQIEVARQMGISARMIHYKFESIKEKIRGFINKNAK